METDLKRIFLLFAFTPLLQPSAVMAEATFSGGKGTSLKDAVIVDAAGEYEGVKAEYGWLHQNNPGCKKSAQSVTSEGGRSYDVVEIQCASEKRTIHFDITSFFGKM